MLTKIFRYIIFRFAEGAKENFTTTVVDYFQKRYKYKLKYIYWPCLQCGSSRDIFLPMEVPFQNLIININIKVLIISFFFRFARFYQGKGTVGSLLRDRQLSY